MTQLDHATLADLFRQAKAAPRLRSHLLLHSGHDDQVQRLVIALCAGTYVRAHRHSEQWEILTLLQGRMDLLLFSPDGRLSERIALGAGRTTLVQIPPGQVHCGVVVEDETAILEVKPGPFRANEFEAWSPEEGSADAAAFVDWAMRAEIGASWIERG